MHLQNIVTRYDLTFEAIQYVPWTQISQHRYKVLGRLDLAKCHQAINDRRGLIPLIDIPPYTESFGFGLLVECDEETVFSIPHFKGRDSNELEFWIEHLTQNDFPLSIVHCCSFLQTRYARELLPSNAEMTYMALAVLSFVQSSHRYKKLFPNLPFFKPKRIGRDESIDVIEHRKMWSHPLANAMDLDFLLELDNVVLQELRYFHSNILTILEDALASVEKESDKQLSCIQQTIQCLKRYPIIVIG